MASEMETRKSSLGDKDQGGGGIEDKDVNSSSSDVNSPHKGECNGSLVAEPDSQADSWLKQLRLKENGGLKKAKEDAKVRTRIRSRLADPTDWRQELETLESDARKPLITAADIKKIRSEITMPEGVFMPKPEELTLGYDTAWDIGKRGCVAYKLSGDFDIRIGPNKMRFWVMDGTSQESFLTYYTKPGILVEMGEISQRKGTIRLADMREGFWNYKKKKVRIYKTDGSGGIRVLENFPHRFFDAMLVCLREADIQAKTAALREARLLERREETWKLYLARRQKREQQQNANRNGPRASIVASSLKQLRHTVTDISVYESKGSANPTQKKRCASESPVPQAGAFLSAHGGIIPPINPDRPSTGPMPLEDIVESSTPRSRIHSSDWRDDQHRVDDTGNSPPTVTSKAVVTDHTLLPPRKPKVPDLVLGADQVGQSIYITKASDVDFNK